MTRTITITSGKGGVGKTTISLNLSLYLATLGYRTCLFDADLGLANVNILLGLYPEYNLEDVILYQRDLQDVIIRDYEGIDIIPGSSGVERIANLETSQIEHLITAFSELDGYDFILFDTSAGVSKNVISFCLASSEVILVITPEVASLADAYALLKILCLNGFKGSVKIVVNQSRSASVAKHAYSKFKQTVKKYLLLDVVPLGIIVQDDSVEEAVKEQQALLLLDSESNASKCIMSIGNRLVEDIPADLEPSGMSLFWTRSLKFITNPLKLTVKEKKEHKTDSKSSEHAQPAEKKSSVPQRLQPGGRRDIFKGIDIHKNLPTLPHVALKLIEVCNKNENTIENIAQIVNKDASLSAKVLSMVSSAGSGPNSRVNSIEEAVCLMGKNAMKTIAVCTAACSGFVQNKAGSIVSLKLFWAHSVMCANLARLIAGKVSYHAPDEAFLSGLLHDIGKLVLLVNFPKEYVEIIKSCGNRPDLLLKEEALLAANHCEVGARVINQWNLQSFLADAVLYHHEPTQRISDALPLVKIVHVANILCSENREEFDAAFKTAEEIFGFSGPEAKELILLADKEVKRVAESLGIEVELVEPAEPSGASEGLIREKDAEKQKALDDSIRDISKLQGTFQNLLEADGEGAVLKVIKRGLQVLFDVHSALFFLYDRQQDILTGKWPEVNKEKQPSGCLSIPCQEEKSLLVQSLSRETILNSFNNKTGADPTIMDNQLVRFLGKDGILYLPLVSNRTKVGVIAMGIDEHHFSHLRNQIQLLTMFANQAAMALAGDHLRQSETNRLKNVLKNIEEVLAKG